MLIKQTCFIFHAFRLAVFVNRIFTIQNLIDMMMMLLIVMM